MNPRDIYPVILAAGASGCLPAPKPLMRFGSKTAVEIAVENCGGLARPIVVLGAEARRIRPAVPESAFVVRNRQWRAGQLRSLLAGLRRVPRCAPFLLYPVDYPLLSRHVMQKLVGAFRQTAPHQTIVLPVFRGRAGHPVIFSSTVRRELERARTAKEVIYRDKSRLKRVPVRTASVCKDFNDLPSYGRLLREENRRRRLKANHGRRRPKTKPRTQP